MPSGKLQLALRFFFSPSPLDTPHPAPYTHPVARGHLLVLLGRASAVDWLIFLGSLLSELVPVAQNLALGAAGSLTASGLLALIAQARAAHRRGRLTPELLAQAIREHLPAISEQLQANWMRTFEVRLDVEEVLRRLGPVTEALDRLQNLQGVDHNLVKLLALKVHELFDGLAPMAAQHDEQIRLLQELRARFSASLPPRFAVVRDLDAPDAFARLLRVLDLHPERVYLDQLVERPDLLRQARPGANTLITGLPGAGKTTLMHQILLRDRPEAAVVVREGFGSHPDDLRWLLHDDLPAAFAVVYDNVQWHPQAFRDALLNLRQLRPGVRILCACRSTDLHRVEQEIAGFRETLHIDCEVHVPALTPPEAAGVVALCERSWGIQVEEGLREWLVERGGQTYATPFYFISLLAPVRAKPDHTARLVDMLALPEDAQNSVVAMWGEYFRRLDPKCRDLLRAVRMVHDMELPADLMWVSRVVEGVFGLSDLEQRHARERLTELFWLSRAEARYSCYDVQLEAIAIPQEDHDRVVAWVLGLPGPPGLRRQFLLHGGVMEQSRAARVPEGTMRVKALAAAADLWETGAHECIGPERLAGRARFLNNASICFADLAMAAEGKEERRAQLGRAVACIEEAVELYRRLDLPDEYGKSLNNASNRYSDLMRTAEDLDEGRGHLDRAVAYIEEAVELYHRLDRPAELGTSLNNASNRYAEQATVAQDAKELRAHLIRAVACIEEAVELYRQQRLPADLASTLNNAAIRYMDLARAAEGGDERRAHLVRAVACIEEAVGIRRRLNLRADLATSLNVASDLYAALAMAVAGVEERQAPLDRAVACIEEAVFIGRRLDLQAELAMSLNIASKFYAFLATATEDAEKRRAQLGRAVAFIDEAVGVCRRLDLPTELAASLTKASVSYAALAATEGVEERQRHLVHAMTCIEEAVGIGRRRGPLTDLAEGLATKAALCQVMAATVDGSTGGKEWVERAVAAIDEAIGLFERAGQAVGLMWAYPIGIGVHLPLGNERPESRMKARDYARKAIPLLRAYGQEEQAREMEELLKRLGEDGES